MTAASFSAGERKLPGVGALVIAAAILASCMASGPVASPAASPDAVGTIPMLGAKPPAGLVLVSYFVTITSSADGSVVVLTTPGSSCRLTVHRPSGATFDGGAATANDAGVASFTYPALADLGETIQIASCAFDGTSGSAAAQVVRP